MMNVRTWGVIEDTHVVHKATCRRCGGSASSVNDEAPIAKFQEDHGNCDGGDEVY